MTHLPRGGGRVRVWGPLRSRCLDPVLGGSGRGRRGREEGGPALRHSYRGPPLQGTAPPVPSVTPGTRRRRGHSSAGPVGLWALSATTATVAVGGAPGQGGGPRRGRGPSRALGARQAESESSRGSPQALGVGVEVSLPPSCPGARSKRGPHGPPLPRALRLWGLSCPS